MKRVGDFLDGKVVSTEPVTYKALGMFPILEAISQMDFFKVILLEEALQERTIHITEVGEG